MVMPICPRCGSSQIDEDLMPYGPMVCTDCGFRVEDKTARPNPFLEAALARASANDQAQEPKLSLSAALVELSNAARRRRAADPPEAPESSGEEDSPPDPGPPGC